MFSIIIPLYNKAPYIEKSILSVLSQTYQDFELIIVNDGSTDDSLNNAQFLIHNLELNEPAQFEKIKLIDQENQGVSVARNNGVKLAKYDYIAFLDADDWWAPTYLEEMKGMIGQFPAAGIYGSSYYKVKDKQYIPANIGVEPGFERGIINYCRVYAKTMYQPIWTGAAVLRKEVYEKEGGFKTSLKLGEDFDLWIRIALKYPVALLNKPLAYYNQDVEFANRAIGDKFYKPEEHMLFSDYSEFKNNPDFVYLFEVLAVYGLLPYYLTGKSKDEVNAILKEIHWDNHPFKNRLFYRILPRTVVKLYLQIIKLGSQIKAELRR